MYQMRRADCGRGAVLRTVRAERNGGAAKACAAACREDADPAARKRAGSPAAGILAVCCVLLLAAGVFLYLTGSAKLRSQQTELDRLREETAFFDQYAVCVNIGSEWYHRYGCARFVPENFEILNEKLATAEGYLPCPDCAGQ